MRKIERSNAPDDFTAFAKSHPNNNWDDIHKPEAQGLGYKIKKLLWEDQEHRSGYTERLLSVDAKTTHIDHFRRKAIYASLTYDWLNYVVDEHNKNFGADYKDKVPAAELDYELLINPVLENAQEFFDYNEAGDILPKRGLEENKSKRARYTIDVFNLNYSELREDRKGIISQARDCKTSGCGVDEILSWFKDCPFISAVEWELAQE